ncbi:hypothetical protein [Glaciihabitans sp. dw_435]|uniref:hypothetical protein n=1 Tax=Glaciihabitans sp. dw_435 TaxID=2720081 RepID=UPI001BD5489A|nr:hypothetical protein [Glaciihabitans sp. dw_435]
MTTARHPAPAHGSIADASSPAVSLRDVAAYYRRHSTTPSRRWSATTLIVLVYLVAQVIFIRVILPASGLDAATQRQVFAWFCVATALYTGFLGWLIWRNIARQVRVDRLASASGLLYSEREAVSRFAGTVLQRPGRQFATDVVTTDVGSDLDFAAATFALSAGLTPRRAGFVQIRLERTTPHIVLENRRSRVLRSSGSRFRHNQRLSLEGDFDRHFTLYCPEGYERDALYIFTPDLMALMIDVAADCEIELVDGSLILYVGHPWRLWKPRRFAAMLTLTDALGAKATRQTRRYSDDRALPGAQLAEEGRRLRVRLTAGSILSIAAPLALGIYGVISLFYR